MALGIIITTLVLAVVAPVGFVFIPTDNNDEYENKEFLEDHE